MVVGDWLLTMLISLLEEKGGLRRYWRIGSFFLLSSEWAS
jgi:hypothetical protein